MTKPPVKSSAQSPAKSPAQSPVKPPAIAEKIARGINPFHGQRAAQLVPQARLAGPMPWVIAIMIALTVIAAGAGLALHNMTNQAREELAGGVTVQIIEALPSERNDQALAAEAALAINPEVASVRRVPDEELDALLEPWLGVDANNEAVPVPALIDVRLRGEASENILNKLRNIVTEVAPSARIDAQASWLRPIFSAIAALQWLSGALVILLGLTSAAAVWLAARSALGANRGTIEIVYLLGGTDRQIARIFERSIGFDAALGGAAGLALGFMTILFFGQRFDDLGSGMMAGGVLGWFDWVLIISIPVFGVGLAMLTARLTVLAVLRRML